MENFTVSQAMIKVAELEKIYRNKLYTLSDIDNYIRSRQPKICLQRAF